MKRVESLTPRCEPVNEPMTQRVAAMLLSTSIVLGCRAVAQMLLITPTKVIVLEAAAASDGGGMDDFAGGALWSKSICDKSIVVFEKNLSSVRNG
jgi:hypothetical protein